MLLGPLLLPAGNGYQLDLVGRVRAWDHLAVDVGRRDDA
jgi:hypothetical protein